MRASFYVKCRVTLSSLKSIMERCKQFLNYESSRDSVLQKFREMTRTVSGKIRKSHVTAT